MGSVSSLVNGHSPSDKQCQASEGRLRKGPTSHRKTGSSSLDGLLKYGFTQRSSASAHPTKGLSHSQSGRSEDFFYIKVSHKPRPLHGRGGVTEDHLGRGKSDVESVGRLPPKQQTALGSMAERATAEKSLIRPTAFKPVIPRSSSSTENSHDHFLSPLEGPMESEGPKQDRFSGTLSDSGHNSMSSLPTHSTSDSFSATAGFAAVNSTPASGHCQGPRPNCPPWTSGNAVSPSTSSKAAFISGGATSKTNGNIGFLPSPNQSSPLSETGGGIRSPITPDESLIERLEQRLLERESELQELQVSFEEREADTCQLFEDRQKYCVEEMEGLKQRCSSKLRQVSQKAVLNQQALQLQVNCLQAEKARLQEDVARLAREKDLVEVRLRSCESHSTQLAPTLEETQWEVCQKTGEISLLKQQLRDCQADLGHKLNEIVSLKASLKETKLKVEALEGENTEYQNKIHSRTVEAEVCQNELQRKKNEADLLREKVGQLEKDIQGMKQDLLLAKEQRRRQKSETSLKLEAQAHIQASERSGKNPVSPNQSQGEDSEANASTDCLQREVERLKGQLREEKETQERLTYRFEQERQTWNKEKDRVIKYQKQLQLNYLQMHKKNKDLERILQELSAELESRTELDMEILHGSGLKTYEDVIATEI